MQVRHAAQRYLDLKKSGATQANSSPMVPDQDLKINGPVEDPHGHSSLEQAGHTVADAVALAFSSRSADGQGEEGHRCVKRVEQV